jgi:[ribosomal protein S5]-alanine N-acetyltransferase
MSEYIYEDNLQSNRLKTRFATEDDVPAWSEFFKDESSVAYLPKHDFASFEARAEDWIKRQINRYKNQEYGLQFLHDKTTNELIGQCGLILQEVDGRKEIEVGYHVLPWHRGKGYAPEAAKCFIDYAFENKITDSVISLIHVDNLNSKRVAEKNGLVRERTTVFKGIEAYVYRMLNTSIMI